MAGWEEKCYWLGEGRRRGGGGIERLLLISVMILATSRTQETRIA